ncbi:MAG: hypothetical protein ACHQXG_09100, partial [Nitrososphaerales archaeon]
SDTLNSLMNEMKLVRSSLSQPRGTAQPVTRPVQPAVNSGVSMPLSTTNTCTATMANSQSLSAVNSSGKDAFPVQVVSNKTIQWSDVMKSRDREGTSVSDIDSDSAGFTTAMSRSTKKINKRLANSPTSNLAKKGHYGNGTITQSVEKKSVINSSSNRIVNPLIRGSAVSGNSKLRAASEKKMIDKAVVCISNLSRDCGVEDIRTHCKGMGVRVLFCFDISNLDYSSKAFKLAIPATDVDRVFVCNFWPEDVVVRRWGRTVRAGEAIVSEAEGRGNDVHESSSIQINSTPVDSLQSPAAVESDLPVNSTIVEGKDASISIPPTSPVSRSTSALDRSHSSNMESDDPFALNDDTILTQIAVSSCDSNTVSETISS